MRAFWSVCLMLLACSTPELREDTSPASAAQPWGDFPAWMSEGEPGAAQVEEGRQAVSAAPALTIAEAPVFERGGTVPVTVTGATPGSNVFFIVGPYAEDHTCPPPLGGACVDINFSKGRYLGKAVADDSGEATLDVVVPDTERVGEFIDAGYAAFTQAVQMTPVAISAATSAVVCDDTLACAEVITCFGSDAYPTACGPANCDVPIGTCDECGVYDGPGIVEGTCDCDGTPIPNVFAEADMPEGSYIGFDPADSKVYIKVMSYPHNPDGSATLTLNGEAFDMAHNSIASDLASSGFDSEWFYGFVPEADTTYEWSVVISSDCADGDTVSGSFTTDCAAHPSNGATVDECGTCGGSGIPDGACDCTGLVEDECGE